VASLFTTERRSTRRPYDAHVCIQRRDGSVIYGQCFDASHEGFGVVANVPVGEIVRVKVGDAENAPSFVARVVWQQGPRIGLYCVASKPLDLGEGGVRASAR
jgi:PilZ domain